MTTTTTVEEKKTFAPVPRSLSELAAEISPALENLEYLPLLRKRLQCIVTDATGAIVERITNPSVACRVVNVSANQGDSELLISVAIQDAVAILSLRSFLRIFGELAEDDLNAFVRGRFGASDITTLVAKVRVFQRRDEAKALKLKKEAEAVERAAEQAKFMEQNPVYGSW